MNNEKIKNKLSTKLFKSIPGFIWSLCASYGLIMLVNLFVLNFAHIDADKHINRYLDILLKRQEAITLPNKDLTNEILELEKRIKELEKHSHKPT